MLSWGKTMRRVLVEYRHRDEKSKLFLESDSYIVLI